MKILSLGWGVQSFTLAAMSALGELEPIDAAIHSDTGYESQLTYEFAKRWTGWLEDHGVKVVTVHGTNGTLDELFYTTKSGNKFLRIPSFIRIKMGQVQSDPASVLLIGKSCLCGDGNKKTAINSQLSNGLELVWMKWNA